MLLYKAVVKVCVQSTLWSCLTFIADSAVNLCDICQTFVLEVKAGIFFCNIRLNMCRISSCNDAPSSAVGRYAVIVMESISSVILLCGWYGEVCPGLY